MPAAAEDFNSAVKGMAKPDAGAAGQRPEPGAEAVMAEVNSLYIGRMAKQAFGIVFRKNAAVSGNMHSFNSALNRYSMTTQEKNYAAELKRTFKPGSLAMLNNVNAYWNSAIKYRSDMSNYKKQDYWASPKEAIANGGDCEDYAIAKYRSLVAAGWDKDKLAIVVTQLEGSDDPTKTHAFLVAEADDGKSYALDILTKDRQTVYPFNHKPSYGAPEVFVTEKMQYAYVPQKDQPMDYGVRATSNVPSVNAVNAASSKVQKAASPSSSSSKTPAKSSSPSSSSSKTSSKSTSYSSSSSSSYKTAYSSRLETTFASLFSPIFDSFKKSSAMTAANDEEDGVRLGMGATFGTYA